MSQNWHISGCLGGARWERNARFSSKHPQPDFGEAFTNSGSKYHLLHTYAAQCATHLAVAFTKLEYTNSLVLRGRRQRRLRKLELTNKPPSSSASSAVRSVFKSPPTIMIPNSENPVSQAFFNPAPPSNSPKRERPKARKDDPKSQPLPPPPPGKMIRTRKMIELIKWEPKTHQPKSRRQRDSTLEMMAKKSIRKKSKTNLRDVRAKAEAKTVKNKKSQQKRIVNSTFIVD